MKIIEKLHKFYKKSHKINMFAGFIIQFILLQIADFMTTMVGLSLGANEINPLLKDTAHNNPELLFIIKMALSMLAIGLFSLSFFVLSKKKKTLNRKRFTAMSLFVSVCLMFGIVMSNTMQITIYTLWVMFN